MYCERSVVYVRCVFWANILLVFLWAPSHWYVDF